MLNDPVDIPNAFAMSILRRGFSSKIMIIVCSLNDNLVQIFIKWELIA